MHTRYTGGWYQAIDAGAWAAAAAAAAAEPRVGGGAWGAAARLALKLTRTTLSLKLLATGATRTVSLPKAHCGSSEWVKATPFFPQFLGPLPLSLSLSLSLSVPLSLSLCVCAVSFFPSPVSLYSPFTLCARVFARSQPECF